METSTKTNESIQESMKALERLVSQGNAALLEGYNQQMAFWNNYVNNMMSSLGTTGKSWNPFQFTNSNSINDIWSNWMKIFLKSDSGVEGINNALFWNKLFSQYSEVAKTGFGDYQTRFKNMQTTLSGIYQLMSEMYTRQNDFNKSYYSAIINSINRQMQCMADAQKKMIEETSGYGDNMFRQSQQAMNDFLQILQHMNPQTEKAYKETAVTEIKRKVPSPVVVQ